ncbi:MAG: DUF4421 family protein [Chitinophagaceae bacterium]
MCLIRKPYLIVIKWMILFIAGQICCLDIQSQVGVDSSYISDFSLPYVAKIALERTGAGIQVSPDNSLVPPTASFPFNTGLNLGVYLSYKFINLSVSQSLASKTNNRSLVVALNTYNQGNSFGGKIGFYNNVAAIQDKKNLNVRSAINLFKVSPYWLVNTNYKKFSLAAISDYSKRQQRSAGAFLFELNPFFLQARGKNGLIIPSENYYRSIFEDMAGLQKLTIINLDFRAGYAYTKVFDDGEYFIAGGLLLGPGFGYHHASTATKKERGMHWQSSVRMMGTLGYNGDDYFLAGSFRYTNSFTPISDLGVLADEGLFMITFGLRFDAFEDILPDTWEELIGR